MDLTQNDKKIKKEGRNISIKNFIVFLVIIFFILFTKTGYPFHAIFIKNVFGEILGALIGVIIIPTVFIGLYYIIGVLGQKTKKNFLYKLMIGTSIITIISIFTEDSKYFENPFIAFILLGLGGFYILAFSEKDSTYSPKEEEKKKEQSLKEPQKEDFITNEEEFYVYFYISLVIIIGLLFYQNSKENSYTSGNTQYSSDNSHLSAVQQIVQKSIEKFSLEVRATPSNSKIEILNINKPYSKNMKLTKGIYTIRVSHNGYKTFTKTIQLEYEAYVTAILEKEKIDIPLKKTTTQENHYSAKYKYQENGYKCDIKWVIDNKGEKFKPTNANLQEFTIQLIDDVDNLYLKTQNTESIYPYYSFINSNNNNFGIEYQSNSRFVDIFEDGSLYLGSKKEGIDMKFYCQDIYLEITQTSGSENKLLPIENQETTTIHKTEKKSKTSQPKKYSLTIQRTPLEAQVRILNIKPKYHDGIKLKQGKYHIEVSRRGYKTVKRWVKLKEKNTYYFKLIRKKEEKIVSLNNNYSNVKISSKKRKNYNDCILGKYPNLCKHS